MMEPSEKDSILTHSSLDTSVLLRLAEDFVRPALRTAKRKKQRPAAFASECRASSNHRQTGHAPFLHSEHRDQLWHGRRLHRW